MYMTRSDKKAERIFFKVRGKPENFVPETKKERELKNKLDYQVIVGGR